MMLRRSIFVILLLVAGALNSDAAGTFGSFCCSSSGAASGPSQYVGTNLTVVTYYTSEQPFLNIFKTGGWTTLNSGTPTSETVLLYQSFLDSNGYPNELTGGATHSFNQVSAVLLYALGSLYYQAGDYLLQWSGDGQINYSGDSGSGSCSTSGTTAQQSPCKITVSSPGNGGVLLTLVCTGNTGSVTSCGGATHATNISFIYCGTYTSGNPTGSQCTCYQTPCNSTTLYNTPYDELNIQCQAGTYASCFNPAWLNNFKNFKTFRFMDWMNTIGNFQTNWTDRPTPGWVFWDDSKTAKTLLGVTGLNDGVPAEIMFGLCNATGADCWFNMPPLATDSYVTSFADLALSTLTSGTSKVYVEYANEVWNAVFGSGQTGEVCGSISGTGLTVSSVGPDGSTPILSPLGVAVGTGYEPITSGGTYNTGNGATSLTMKYPTCLGVGTTITVAFTVPVGGCTTGDWCLLNGNYTTTSGTTGTTINFTATPGLGSLSIDPTGNVNGPAITGAYKYCLGTTVVGGSYQCTQITAGGPGGTGTYTVNTSQTVPSETMVVTLQVAAQLGYLSSQTYPVGGTPQYAIPYGALRAVQVGQDWKAAWSNSARVVRVQGLQAGYITGRDDCILDQLPDGASAACSFPTQGGPTYWYGTQGGTVATNVDVNAIAPYFQSYIIPDAWGGNSDGGVANLVNDALTGVLPSSLDTGSCGGAAGSTCGTSTTYTFTTSQVITDPPANGTMLAAKMSVANGASPQITVTGNTGSGSAISAPILNNDGSCSGTPVSSGALALNSSYILVYTSNVGANCSGSGPITAGWRVTTTHALGSASGWVNVAVGYINDGCVLANTYSSKMVGYEGGQQYSVNTGNSTVAPPMELAANRSTGMGTAYTQLWNGWKAATGGCTVGVLNQYNDVDQSNTGGYTNFWGALENFQQTSAPKYNALIAE